MTILLAVIAGILLLVIVGTIVGQDRGSDLLRFTQPDELAAGLEASKSAPVPDGFAATAGPEASSEEHEVVTLEELMARRQAASASSPEAFLPGNLGIGTNLTRDRNVSQIVGVIRFDFKDELWQDYILVDNTGRRWRLSVEPHGSLRLAAFELRAAHIEPGAAFITFEDKAFELDESGRANYRAVGDTGYFEAGSYYFSDYLAGDGTILNIERFDNGQWQVSLGQSVNPQNFAVTNHPLPSGT